LEGTSAMFAVCFCLDLRDQRICPIFVYCLGDHRKGASNCCHFILRVFDNAGKARSLPLECSPVRGSILLCKFRLGWK